MQSFLFNFPIFIDCHLFNILGFSIFNIKINNMSKRVSQLNISELDEDYKRKRIKEDTTPEKVNGKSTV